MASRPTVQSLAKDLGVSRQTISNAINRPEVVTPDTLERVLKHIPRVRLRAIARLVSSRKIGRAKSRSAYFRPLTESTDTFWTSSFMTWLKSARGYRLSVFRQKTREGRNKQYETMYRRARSTASSSRNGSNDPRIDSLLN